MSFAKGFGSYVGEVFRRNHGGEWGMVTLGDHRFPGLRTTSGTNFGRGREHSIELQKALKQTFPTTTMCY